MTRESPEPAVSTWRQTPSDGRVGDVTANTRSGACHERCRRGSRMLSPDQSAHAGQPVVTGPRGHLVSFFTLFCIFHIFKSVNFVTGTSAFLFVKVASLSPGPPRPEGLLSALGPEPNPERASESRPSR